MKRLGLEQLSVLGMPPVAFVHFAADLGCANISLTLTPRPFNPYNYAPWSLLDDVSLRKEFKAALKACGVTPSLGEGMVITPDTSVRGLQSRLDIFAELGIVNANLYSMERDLSRTRDEAAIFAEMAGLCGIKTVIEFSPVNPNNNLATALQTVKHMGRDDCGVLIDSMHFFRSGGTIAELKAVDPAMIGYIQICDVPLKSNEDYMQEAIGNRLAPGDGELPLQEFLNALPKHLVVGLELPRAAKAMADKDPRDYLGRAIERARTLIDSIA